MGVTRFNLDGSCGSTVSGSACNSPMINRDLNPSFHGGKLIIHYLTEIAL